LTYSGASAREARQRSTMGKKNWRGWVGGGVVGLQKMEGKTKEIIIAYPLDKL